MSNINKKNYFLSCIRILDKFEDAIIEYESFSSDIYGKPLFKNTITIDKNLKDDLDNCLQYISKHI